jgi:hypothetical protein
VGGVIGLVAGGVVGAFSYGKCVEGGNARCRARGSAVSKGCDEKFPPAVGQAGIPEVNVEELPQAPPPEVNVEELPAASAE